MKIYTKTGDRGETKLFSGLKVKKSHKIIEALGAVDELNAWMGMIEVKSQKLKVKNTSKNSKFLGEIQEDLMEISSALAGFKSLKSLKVEKLEKEIDRMTKKLPPLKNFILPQNNIHIARAVCRRVERRVIYSGAAQNDVVKYLNRLSDYLFVFARYEDFKKGRKEIIWKNEGKKLLDRVREGTGIRKRD